jgi:hypothetical protein
MTVHPIGCRDPFAEFPETLQQNGTTLKGATGMHWLLLTAFAAAQAEAQVLTPKMHHLRAEGLREWSDFANTPDGKSLRLNFRAEKNAQESTLLLRQRDVKEQWRVVLNGKPIGKLVQDENPITLRLAVPPGALKDGDNILLVEQTNKAVDDVLVGGAAIEPKPLKDSLHEASVELEIVDGATGSPVPCRLTLVDSAGSLAALGASSGKGTAVRPGVIYTATGVATFGLPAGEYDLTVGRGFEWGIAQVRFTLKPGETYRRRMEIRREVRLDGWVCCDPHVHTLTGSGHGDCTLDERMATIAGEGLDIAVATEHNKQDDWRSAMARHGVAQHFRSIVGNEVTTDLGHFNVFPLPPGGPTPDHRSKDWPSLFRGIETAAGPKGVVILNHARDRHKGFSPFGLERHVWLSGEDLDEWKLRATGMEVVNSGAQRNDVMDLVRNWMGMLNAGVALAPIGASDSHDVSRYIVGQGRTYIRCDGPRGGDVDVPQAAANLREGKVTSGCGLIATISVNGRHGPGELAPATEETVVAVRVLGPRWTTAERVELYANGIKIREAVVEEPWKSGVHWSGEWKLPKFKHDAWLTVVAVGPGIKSQHWPIAKPYQPTSAVVDPRLLAVTGAVWIDGDADGKRNSPAEIARKVVEAAANDWDKLGAALGEYDESVAIQAAAILRRGGASMTEARLRTAFAKGGPHVERGFGAYAHAWREAQIARARKAASLSGR